MKTAQVSHWMVMWNISVIISLNESRIKITSYIKMYNIYISRVTMYDTFIYKYTTDVYIIYSCFSSVSYWCNCFACCKHVRLNKEIEIRKHRY
jgi:hypothetical protein